MAESIRPNDGDGQRGSSALAESLHLQQAVRDREKAQQRQRGRRRKGKIIDLEQRTAIQPHRRRVLFVILTFESVIAVIAVGVLVAYLWLEGDALQ